MLYNGERAWTAAENIRDLIAPCDFGSYLPDFRYYKICENEFSKEALLKINNIVSALFLVENLDEKEIGVYFEELTRIIEKEKDVEAIKLFSKWITFLLSNARVEERLVNEIEQAKSKKEAATMFAKTAEKLKEGWYQEGIEKGIEKGEVRLLVKLLKRKFSERFTPSMENKVANLSIKQIEDISEKIFEMIDVDELKMHLK